MFLRRLLIWLVIMMTAFIIFLVLSFYLYPYINPPDDELSGQFDLGDFYEYDYEQFGPQAVTDLLAQIRSLEEELEELREQDEENSAVIDSLSELTHEQEEELQEMETMLAAAEELEAVEEVVDEDEEVDPEQLAQDLQEEPDDGNMQARLQEIASNLLLLNEEELAPIVNHLSEDRLLELYEHSSNIQRQQLLRALDPEVAAELVNRASS